MKNFAVLFLILFGLGEIACSQKPEPFHKGERVAFVGNSITDGGHYHSYIWLYYMTRFPDQRIDIFNCGIGGDVSGDILKRLDDDVFIHKPTTIFLTFGMNDVGYYEFYKPNAEQLAKEKIQKSIDSYQKIEKRLKEQTNAKKILIGGSPYDETAKFKKEVFPKKNDAIRKIIDFQQKNAAENNWGFIDFNHPMTDINLREQKKDSSFTLCGQDRIHPGNDGHMVMAYLVLKAQGLAGKEVADMKIDAGQKKVNESGNCTISGLTVTPASVQFDYLAKSLPYPLDTFPEGWMETKRQSGAMALVPFMDEFNREMLYVKGLSGKTYTLKIDGAVMGTWPAQKFAEGINLATITKTPEYMQALQVMVLNEERWEIERRLRSYYWMEFTFFRDKGMLFADNEAAMDTLNKYAPSNIFVAGNKGNYVRSRFKSVRDTWHNEMDLLVNEIYTINKPVSHKMEIVREE